MKKRIIKYGGALTGLEEERAIIKSIKKSRKTANWQQAEEGALFEKELAEYVGTKYAVLTNSGSSAGLLALSALELPKGSEVIISAVTFPTIFNIILQCGLTPVVVDAEVGTYVLDTNEIEKAITPKTKAIIAIHAVGNPVDMPKLMKIAKKHKLYVLEDNCDGLGGSINGRRLGSFGDIAITSLHAAHIVSMGVGGCVFTNRGDLAERVRMYRDWGRQANTIQEANFPGIPRDQNPRFIYEKIGYNLQILELQAAMGRVQLRKIGKTKKARQKNFEYLCKNLKPYDALYLYDYGENGLLLPKSLPDADVCWFSFPLTYTGDRGQLLAHLENRGIETRTMFAGNITKHPAYKDSKFRTSGKLPGANYILEHSFWISLHPRLTKEDLKYIIKAFKDYFDGNVE